MPNQFTLPHRQRPTAVTRKAREGKERSGEKESDIGERERKEARRV